MKKLNKKFLVSLMALCLVVSAFASASTFARYTKNLDIAVVNLTVVPPADPGNSQQNEAVEETSGAAETAPTEAVPSAPQESAPTEQSVPTQPGTPAADQNAE